MKFLLIIFLCLFLISFVILQSKNANALVPDFYLPSINNLKKDSLSIGRYAYQLLYYGQLKDGLNLAKLAVKINPYNEELWLILSEAQIANNLYKNALNSLKEAEKINPNISKIYFAKSNIYLKESKLEQAKIEIEKGLNLEPDNQNAIFQLGNIFLMKEEYITALKFYEDVIKLNPNFWQALNNKALIFFEQEKINLSIKFFKKAISIDENAEPLLGLASCLREKDISSALKLAKEALNKNPNYVEYDYRKEQLWGEKLQTSTEKLLMNKELQEEIIIAKSKINKTS